mgnify:CR=1 FL=1
MEPALEYVNATIPDLKMPERNIWLAVINQAIFDLRKDHRSLKSHSARKCGQRSMAKLNSQRARYWLFESRLHGPGSLAWICEHLSLDIDAVRRVARDA